MYTTKKACPAGNEAGLIPNSILFECTFNQVSQYTISITYESIDLWAYGSSVNKVVDPFLDYCRKKYMVHLRETEKFMKSNRNEPVLQINDVPIVNDVKLPRSLWRIGVA